MDEKELNEYLKLQNCAKFVAFDPRVTCAEPDYKLYAVPDKRAMGQRGVSGGYNYGQAISMYQAALNNGATPAQVDASCMDMYGVSFGYMYDRFLLAFALSSFGLININSWLNLPATGLA